MDIASLAIRVENDDTKAAVDALNKLGPAAARAGQSVEGLGAASHRAGEGMAFTSKGAREASEAIDAQIKKWQLDADTIGYTTRQVNLFTIAQKGASAAQLNAANDALGRTGAAKTAAGIDAQINKLQQLAVTQSMSAREAKLHQLGLEGATKAQLDAASSAIKLTEAYDKGQRIGEGFKTGLKAIALATIAAGTAAAYAIGKIAEHVGNYKQLSEVIGDTADAVASLQLASDVSGKSLDEVAQFSIKLTKALAKTDDESKLAGRALASMGIEFDDFKKKSPVEQLEAIAKALKGFDDKGGGKTAVLEALARGGAQLLPFLNDLGDQQERQSILSEQQILRADEFSKAYARQTSALKSLAQVFVIETLPAISDLTHAFKDVIEETFGVKKASDDLKNNNGITDFADSAARAFAKVVDAGAIVVTAIAAVGKTIGGVVAAFASFLKGDLLIAGRIISDTVSDLNNLKAPASVADALDKRIAERKAADKAKEAAGPGSALPRINTAGLSLDKEKKEKGGVTERDLLGFDIALIKQQLDALVSIYKDSESILEATRSAGLLDEREYYAAKLGFIRLNEAEQVRALERENASFRESIASRRGTDKDRLEAQKQIAGNEEKIGRLREHAAAQEVILGTQSSTALKKIAQGYRDAEDAAQSYLDALRLANRRDLEGAGLGGQERSRLAGRQSIEDRFRQQRETLEKTRRDAEAGGTFGDDARAKYDNELAIIRQFQATSLAEYDAYISKRISQEDDFTLGAHDAFQNYIDDAAKTAKMTEDLFTKAFNGMEDALVAFVLTGKLDFKSLANSIIADMTRIAIKQQITGPLAQAMQGGSSGGGWFDTVLGLASAYFGGGGTGTGMSTNNTGGSLPTRGGRAQGGPVSYSINEKGRPEMLTALGGKQYLMAGSQTGNVVANNGGSEQRPIQVSQTFILDQPASKATQSQVAANALRGAQRALARGSAS